MSEAELTEDKLVAPKSHFRNQKKPNSDNLQLILKQISIEKDKDKDSFSWNKGRDSSTYLFPKVYK